MKNLTHRQQQVLDFIRLQPENRRMQPILIRQSDAETVIVGKLLKTIRSHD